MNHDERRSVAIITEASEPFNRYDVDGVLSYFTIDARWLVSQGLPLAGEGLVGIDVICAMHRRRFRDLPDMEREIHSLWADGNPGCSEWTVTSTKINGNRRNWFGCAPNARIEIRMIDEQLPEHAHRAYVVRHFEDRHHVGLENNDQRIRRCRPRCDFGRAMRSGSALSRAPVARLKPAFAAAVAVDKLLFRVMNSLA